MIRSTYVFYVLGFLLLLVLITLAVSAISGSSNNDDKKGTGAPGTTKEYAALWDEVNQALNKGLPQSALKVVEQIYQKAKIEDNASQLVKALLHKMRFLQDVEEETFVKIQKEINDQLTQSQFPVTPVLHSILADLYWRFYQDNRYQILNRTATSADFKQEDIRTWDARRIVEAVFLHYGKSLEDSALSKKVNIAVLDEILYKYTETRVYRPTLYDFLAHRAINFFKDSEAGLTQPQYVFTLNDPCYFAPTRDFAAKKLESKDPLSFNFFAIKYLQDLVNFHLEDDSPEALVDVELERLAFVYQTAVVDNKDGIYETALRRMMTEYEKSPVTAEIYFELGSLYDRQGDNYRPDVSDDYKWHKKKAMDVCQDAIQKYPNSLGASNCQNLIRRIEGKAMQLTVEQAAIPGIPSRALVQYRNIDKIYLKIVKITRAEVAQKQSLRYQDMIAYFIGKPAVKEWQVSLPEDKDYQAHATEIKLDGLESGMFMILAANTPTFDFIQYQQAVAYTIYNMSNIAYIDRQPANNRLELLLMNRETGQSLKNAAVQVWYQEYNQKRQQNEMVKGAQFPADENGYITISKENVKQYYFYLEFIAGQDRLFPERTFNLYDPYAANPTQPRTFFFTDRAIYRPGQTVYFKGIMLQTDSQAGEKCHILPLTASHVTLYDVNQQQIAALDLKSNEYGTYSGSFQLPVGRLNGSMRIADAYGSVSIQMEEYKRPKFKVEFKPLEKSFKLKETITVKGLAVAYAGYNIDNADVKYRVVREAYYPYPWYCRYWYGYYTPPSPAMEIANGYTKTGADGSFEVLFEAKPDVTLAEKTRPAFKFTVSADVTDLNGETRSSEQNVYIGYTALQLSLGLEGQLDKETKEIQVTLNSTNLGGDFLASKGNVAIYKLKEPDRVLRSRLWTKPDKFVIPEAQFRKDFPHDIYNDEDNITKWEKEQKVWNTPFDTAVAKQVKLTGLNGWKTGQYVAEMSSVDAFGNEIKDIRYFTLYSSSDTKMPFSAVEWFSLVKGIVEPGEKAVLLIGSSLKNVRVIYEIEFHGKIIKTEYLQLSNQQKRLEIPITEEHRGNLGFFLTFIQNNRLYTHAENILVPWSNKKLELSFETFRNKLLPGENTEWRIKIKGPKGDKVAAEMVASLYDASLDAFLPHYWGFSVFPYNGITRYWNSNTYFNTIGSQLVGTLYNYENIITRTYDDLNWFGFSWNPYGNRRFYKMARNAAMPEAMPAPMVKAESLSSGITPQAPGMVDGLADKKGGKDGGKNGADEPKTTVPVKAATAEPVQVRTNFNETAFFYPHLQTTAEGEIVIAFTIPEALTKWKMMGFAHTKKLESGFLFNELVTQKDLMVVPNAPRFFREGDALVFTSKITNLSDKELSGTAQLTLLDAVTMKPVDASFKLTDSGKPFIVKKGQSALVSWSIEVPDDYDAVTYRVIARAGKFSDGEEMVVPILRNRMLVTESMPLPVRAKQTKTFQFDKLIASATSKTLKHQRVTLEFTSNPVWYAVQALPYMIEYPHECMEQMFSRFYANSMAAHIVNANPKIKSVFNLWKNAIDAKDSPNANALLSNLEKNQELKSVLLEETPWVLNGQNETQRKRRIALLFDLNEMANQMERTLKKMSEGQMASGAWPWFKGMQESRWITQHIVCGFAHLGVLNVLNIKTNPDISRMISQAVPYLDREITKDYKWLIKNDVDLNLNHLGFTQIHYLYARSYFQHIPMDAANQKAFQYYKGQAKKYWTDFQTNKYIQGMIALSLKRYGDTPTALAIGKSIKEFALYSEEMGMYWKSSYGYYWYQAPIETHALLIEVFSEVMNDAKSVDELKTWLLKSKQTQDWGTTKATAEACYALLLKGDDWLKENLPPEITLGKDNPLVIIPGKYTATTGNSETTAVEAGTGYFKTSWTGKDIVSDMGYVKVQNNNSIVAWGSLYWQYFENLDKITPADTPLKLSKKLFVEKPSDTGPVLHPITAATSVKVGDRIKVRIELRVDRDMEYVHMKDMRAATMEPENVISGYRWQDGLGYYQTTKDSSTNFFFDYLAKGTYVFEYPMRVTHEGDFSNGITSIQCMYAPEFTSHSEGVRVKIGTK